MIFLNILLFKLILILSCSILIFNFIAFLASRFIYIFSILNKYFYNLLCLFREYEYYYESKLAFNVEG